MSVLKETWRPGAGFEYPNAVLEIKETMNQYGLQQVMEDIPVLDRDRSRGIDNAVIGDASSSTTEAVVLFLAFANRLTNHNLIKADFLRRVLARAGMTDTSGKELPIIICASPSLGSNIQGIDATDKAYIERGYLHSAVSPYLDAVREKGFVAATFAGHSQGANFTICAAGLAYDKGLDVVTAAPSDMTGTKPFKKPELLSTFTADAEYLETEVVIAGLTAYADAMGYSSKPSWLKRRRQDARYMVDVLSHPRLSNLLFTALAKPSFLPALKDAAYNSAEHFTVGYGSEDQIVAAGDEIEHDLERVRKSFIPTPDISSVEIVGGRHTWSDNVPLYSAFVLHAINRAKAA